MANKIQLRRGTKAHLATLGALSAGEPGYTTDTKELYIGNGAGANTPVVTATSTDITYYVRTDGNDANTGLANTTGGALKTIGKAASMVPQAVNHTVAINVAAGTYAEDVLISGTNGAGYVAFNGTSANIRSFTAARCSRVVVSGFTGTSTSQSPFYAYDGGKCDFNNCITTVSGSSAAGVAIFNQDSTIEGCTISNRGTAIQAEKGQVTVVNCTGTGNSTAILPSGGALVNTAGTLMSGALDGANGGVINPWGDNTTESRSTVWAWRSANAAVSANTFTTVIFDGEGTDKLSEYNNAIGGFTPLKSGWYAINTRVLCSSLPAGSILYLRFLNVTTSSSYDMDRVNGGGQDAAAQGSLLVFIHAGETIVIQINPAGTTTTVYGGYQFTRLEIIRVA
ncbi:hypothetical protein [Paenibacillus sp. FSL H8-0259]|uniref:hyaluronate lyase N-terminal domain-containing protein n=1 Tax=Paenibacillus sp. FSL H8-0259 TaxID=1920423 RepID=UPI00096E902B|nr:hypothetical protein [Paenibacillus sp. FSL H8-0259]OMF30969.1 hypothetical protein BK132_05935 [Paenibacillus sp. FSL H8-0259]